MKIQYRAMPSWPPLAWACRCSEGETNVTVFHGSKVETREEWFCEAVWDGEFSAGSFDETEVVEGSGGRMRDGGLVFVSSGSTVDRLQWIGKGNPLWISNSLACLLSMVDASVKVGHGRYFDDLGKIVGGLGELPLRLETSKGPVNFVYFHNVIWNGVDLAIQQKPVLDRKIEIFADYHDLLSGAIGRLSRNMADPARKIRYELVGTLSSGYDSTTVTTLGSVVGCGEAIGFERGRGGNEDHGSLAAKALEVNLTLLDREAWVGQEKEYLFISVDAKGEDRYFVSAENMLANKVLLTGYHGDKIWDKKTKKLSRDIVRGDRSGLSLSEYRLHAGFINCPVPFWYARDIKDIIRISNSDEMKPWDIGPSYSRPICRRICEEAGIPRGAFGVKKNASSEQPFTSNEFLSPVLMNDYIGWMKKHRWKLVAQNGFPLVVSPALDKLLCNGINRFASFVRKAVPRMAGVPLLWRYANSEFLFRLSMLDVLAKPMYLRRYIFPWALDRAKQHYPAPGDLQYEAAPLDGA
jgi:hypothetical protein